ncbi:retrovirus-related pol polyprotein from transposon TNT 1-94, partial [Tanacetum coccineum]
MTAIIGYGDLQFGNVLITRFYSVEGLGHNLFSVGQFYDSDLKVALRKHMCFVRKLDDVDLLSGYCGSNLYTISLKDMMKSSPICLLSKASKTKSCLWHRCLSHLNFNTINQLGKQDLVRGLPKLKYAKGHLCYAYQMIKRKKESHKPKPEPSLITKLHTLHMDLCGPMRVESINEKKYILVIVDDYSRFTWVMFLRTKDKTPEIIIKFLKQAQVSLQATVQYLLTDNKTKFINQTLRTYTEDVGITHQTSLKLSLPLVILKIDPSFIPDTIRLLMNYSEIGNQISSSFTSLVQSYFQPTPSVVSTLVSAATLPTPDIAKASSSTTIDQEASSPSYQNGFKINLYVEHHGYDVTKMVRNPTLDAPLVDDYVSSNEECATVPEFVNVHIEDYPIPPLEGTYVEETDPYENIVDMKYKVKSGISRCSSKGKLKKAHVMSSGPSANEHEQGTSKTPSKGKAKSTEKKPTKDKGKVVKREPTQGKGKSVQNEPESANTPTKWTKEKIRRLKETPTNHYCTFRLWALFLGKKYKKNQDYLLSYHIKMDSIIPLGQKNTLAEYMILSGADNHPPMLDKDLVAKDLWERFQLLMQDTSLTKQESECKLYDAFDKFTHIKGETLHKYYLRFTQLINDMNIYKMKMEQFQVNTK